MPATRLVPSLLLALSLISPLVAQGQAAAPDAPALQPADFWTEGEIRRVDREGRKLTVRHAEIKNLGMPPMTMVFQVKDPALFDKASVGAKVRFTVQHEGGSYVITGLQSASP